MDIFGIGFGEMLLLFVLVMVVVGPEKLPEVGRKLGSVVGTFRAQTDEMRKVISLDQLTGSSPAREPVNMADSMAKIMAGSAVQINPFDRITSLEPAALPDSQGLASVASVNTESMGVSDGESDQADVTSRPGYSRASGTSNYRGSPYQRGAKMRRENKGTYSQATKRNGSLDN